MIGCEWRGFFFFCLDAKTKIKPENSKLKKLPQKLCFTAKQCLSKHSLRTAATPFILVFLKFVSG
jgi:hypothetical protein